MLSSKAPDYGTLYVQNVYLTRNDPEKKIKPGMIKAIRVNALGVQPRANRAPCSMTVGVELTGGDELAGQPERALVNLAQPDESRILCAPLDVKAGGWGQIQGWKDRNEPGYRKMAELVEACIVRDANENSTGWYPSHEQGGGEEWVIKDQEEYIKRLKGAGKAPAD